MFMLLRETSGSFGKCHGRFERGNIIRSVEGISYLSNWFIRHSDIRR